MLLTTDPWEAQGRQQPRLAPIHTPQAMMMGWRPADRPTEKPITAQMALAAGGGQPRAPRMKPMKKMAKAMSQVWLRTL